MDSETADILGQILNEEEQVSLFNAEEASAKVTIAISHTQEPQISKYLDELQLSDIQKEILDLFEKQSFNILQTDFEDFIKSKGLFMGAAIDTVNECCYEILDDILIEEEDEYFIINTDYYKKLLNND